MSDRREDLLARRTVAPWCRRISWAIYAGGIFANKTSNVYARARPDIIKMNTQEQIEPVSGSQCTTTRARVLCNCNPAIRNAASRTRSMYQPVPSSLPALTRVRFRLNPDALSNCINSSLEPITEPAIFGFHFHVFIFNFFFVIYDPITRWYRAPGTIMDRSIEKMSSRPLIIRSISFFFFFFSLDRGRMKGECTDLRIVACI